MQSSLNHVKNTIYYNEVCHRRTNQESVLSADVGPPITCRETPEEKQKYW